jgi:hypothetical protein
VAVDVEYERFEPCYICVRQQHSIRGMLRCVAALDNIASRLSQHRLTHRVLVWLHSVPY